MSTLAPSNFILQAFGLTKSFRMGEASVRVLDELELSVEEGEFVAIEGRSGEGKSTLLHLLGLLDRPDGGTIHFQGTDLNRLSSNRSAGVRNTQFGFVFQFYHLLPELDVLGNTMTAALIANGPMGYRRRKAELHERAKTLLDAFGLSHRLGHRPQQLSGGERQRVAIARALMNQPRVLFADEPTGNLDAGTGRQIMDVIAGLHRDEGQTIVMVTHDRNLAKTADRALLLREGKLVAA